MGLILITGDVASGKSTLINEARSLEYKCFEIDKFTSIIDDLIDKNWKVTFESIFKKLNKKYMIVLVKHIMC